MGMESEGASSVPHATGSARPIVVATDQLQDLFVHAALGADLRVRLLSQRGREAQTQALRNQDYAVLRSVDGGRSLAFCVCDGVGSSYRGDFAAAYLAVRLVRWLAALPPPAAAASSAAREGEAALHARLSAELLAWSRAGQEELRRLAFPPATGVLVREVLEELREGYGSETVFLAGRVDRLDGPDSGERAAAAAGDAGASGGKGDPPAAVKGVCPGGRMRLVFCRAGNITAQLFGTPDHPEPLSLSTPGDDRDRWSTARHLRGSLQVATADTAGLSRLIVHTDGIDSLSTSLATFSDEALQGHVRRLRDLPGSDDVTILDLRWDHAAPNLARDTDDEAHDIMGTTGAVDGAADERGPGAERARARSPQ
jgi:hypothetical protein